MVFTATVLFAIAALGGLVMAVMRFRGTPKPPSWLAMLHGLLAAAGLTLLIYAAATMGVSGTVLLGTVLIAIAAAGGLFLNLGYHDKNLALPIPIVLIHAGIAVAGFLLLVIAQMPAKTPG